MEQDEETAKSEVRKLEAQLKDIKSDLDHERDVVGDAAKAEERLAAEQGDKLDALTLDEMEALWQQVKQSSNTK